jgi:hypothetical protein
MEKLTRVQEDDRDNFVAYLDGELLEPETRRIESVLTQSEVARHEVGLLAKTWEMLDHLPKVKVSDDFKEKTMASLTIQQIPIPITDQPWFNKAMFIGLVSGWGAILASVTAVGFFIAHYSIPNPNQELLENYELIKHLDSYQEIGSVQFLELLEKSPIWQENLQTSQSPAQN